MILLLTEYRYSFSLNVFIVPRKLRIDTKIIKLEQTVEYLEVLAAMLGAILDLHLT